ncbi:hypothetical protein LINPERHAP1_LOCUS16561, partial [Linum perenne]
VKTTKEVYRRRALSVSKPKRELVGSASDESARRSRDGLTANPDINAKSA